LDEEESEGGSGDHDDAAKVPENAGDAEEESAPVEPEEESDQK